jgi:hypothetical protein
MRRSVLLMAMSLGIGIMGTSSSTFTTLGGPQNASSVAPYTNPVMPGDFPDPSVIRVGRDYWATATTSQWAPIFPLLHSTDLMNWELKGAVFQAAPSWSAGSYWAPEISTHGGRFFVYYRHGRRKAPSAWRSQTPADRRVPTVQGVLLAAPTIFAARTGPLFPPAVNTSDS